MISILKARVNQLVNQRVINSNFEGLNGILEGTGFKVKNDSQIYDNEGLARGAFSLRYINDDEVEILKIVPYGSSDEIALACE